MSYEVCTIARPQVNGERINKHVLNVYFCVTRWVDFSVGFPQWHRSCFLSLHNFTPMMNVLKCKYDVKIVLNVK